MDQQRINDMRETIELCQNHIADADSVLPGTREMASVYKSNADHLGKFLNRNNCSEFTRPFERLIARYEQLAKSEQARLRSLRKLSTEFMHIAILCRKEISELSNNALPQGKTCTDCELLNQCLHEFLLLTYDKAQGGRECHWSPSKFKDVNETGK